MEEEAQCRLNQCAGNTFDGRRPSVVISIPLHISADLPGIAGAPPRLGTQPQAVSAD